MKHMVSLSLVHVIMSSDATAYSIVSGGKGGDMYHSLPDRSVRTPKSPICGLMMLPRRDSACCVA